MMPWIESYPNAQFVIIPGNIDYKNDSILENNEDNTSEYGLAFIFIVIFVIFIVFVVLMGTLV